MIKTAYQNLHARWGEHFLPVALILAITILFFTPRFFSKTYSAVGQHMFATYPWVGIYTPDEGVPNRGFPQTDHAETYYPLSVFVTDAWRNGELPMWLPYSFGGIPIMELGMTSGLYLPRVLLLFFFNPLRQHDLMMFLHLLAAGLGMYALMRCWGVNALGAVIAAFVWEFNGHNTFWLVIEQMAIVAAWCPLMLLGATLAVRHRSFKWAIFAGAAVGIALYSGGTHYVHLSGWLLALWYGTDVLKAALSEFRQRRMRAAIGYLLLPVASLATALVIGLAYWLPLLGVLGEVSRQPLPLGLQLGQGSWRAVALLKAILLPHSASMMKGLPDYLSMAFTGVAAVTLAVVALFLNRSRHVRLAFGFAVLAILTMLGVGWWVKLLYYNVPFFSTMNLYTAFYIFTFAVAVLAGFGAHELARRWTTNKRGFNLLAALVFITGLTQTGLLLRAFHSVFNLTLTQWLSYVLSFRALALMVIIASIFGLAILLSRGFITKARNKIPVLSYATVLIVVLNLFLCAWVTLPYQWAYRDWFFPETPMLTKLKNLQSEWRVLPVYQLASEWTPPVLAGKSNVIFGLRSGHGYESLLPTRTALTWRTAEKRGEIATVNSMPVSSYRPYFQHDRLPISLLEKLSVGLLVTPPNVEPIDAQSCKNLVANGTLRLVYKSQDGWIYENARAPGRAFMVSKTIRVTGEQEALKTFASAEFDAKQAALIEEPLSPQESALLETQPEVESSQPHNIAHIVRESLNEVEIETSSSQAGMLIFNDMWAKGWRATVDGAPQTVHRVNFAVRGVVVAGGQHRVLFRYRPPLLLFSIAISAIALLVLIIWGCVRVAIKFARLGD